MDKARKSIANEMDLWNGRKDFMIDRGFWTGKSRLNLLWEVLANDRTVKGFPAKALLLGIRIF
jgi:hypothetical protein